MTFSRVYEGALWRCFCGWADRARLRRVPLAGLVPYGTSPLTEAACLDRRLLAHPDRLYPAPAPIRPEAWETIDEAPGVEVEVLTFESAAPFGIPVNDRVVARFYRPARGPTRWSLLVLHGIWRRDREFEDGFCRDLARHGVSSVLLPLPFHWERAPRGEPSGAFFLCPDPTWTAAAFRQAIVDGRGMLGLLRGRGVPVGVIGFSLGGIVAHILMAVERVDLGISVITGGDTAGIVWDSPLTRAYRVAMEARGITRSRLQALWATGNPTLYADRPRPPRLVMLGGRYDQLVPRRFTEELWRALGEPPIRWLPAGHVTAFLFRPAIVAETLRVMGLPEAVDVREGAGRRPAPALREAGETA